MCLYRLILQVNSTFSTVRHSVYYLLFAIEKCLKWNIFGDQKLKKAEKKTWKNRTKSRNVHDISQETFTTVDFIWLFASFCAFSTLYGEKTKLKPNCKWIKKKKNKGSEH